MLKSSAVFIPSPCLKPWSQMLPVEGGRHCASCKRIVIDFTISSDEDIVTWFTNHRHLTCGRFYAEQLEQPLPPKKSPKSVRAGWVRWTIALLLGWQSARAQKPTFSEESIPLPIKVTHSALQPILQVRNRISLNPILYIVAGRVIDKTGSPIPGVAIILRGKIQPINTGVDGSFNVPVRLSEGLGNVTIRFAGIGFKGTDIIVNPLSKDGLLIQMKDDDTILGGVLYQRNFTEPAFWSANQLRSGRR